LSNRSSNATVDLFRAFGKVIGSVNLVASSSSRIVGGLSLVFGGIGQLASSDNQLVRLLSTSVHFIPLESSPNGDDGGKSHHQPIRQRNLRCALLESRPAGWSFLALGVVGVFGGVGCVGLLAYFFRTRLLQCCGIVLFGCLLIWFAFQLIFHGMDLLGGKIVTQKHLTAYQLCNTVIAVGRLNPMANVLNMDKQIGVISALAEGSSIRSIERMTGVHRDTIMRLGVKVGQGCTALMDTKMRDLSCNRLEMDEIWGFVGKKERNVRIDEPAPVGSVWTFCAIDAETKLVPAFKVGDRDIATAKAFVGDVASRMRNRVQISTDGLRAYVEAVESAFGSEVDFAQIVKTYGHVEVSDNRRYSAPEFVSSEKKVITGNPDERLISTSYVERLNATTRLHMRRLTRLTLAFSKKRENFEAAVGLHFAYYNFVKRHNTLRCTPAMAAGVERDFWSVGQLLEAAA
jgi:IS1 family transposase